MKAKDQMRIRVKAKSLYPREAQRMMGAPKARVKLVIVKSVKAEWKKVCIVKALQKDFQETQVSSFDP
jgi:hypothetical protein